MPDKVIYLLLLLLPDVPGIGFIRKLPGVTGKAYREAPPGPALRPDLATAAEIMNKK